MFEFSIALKYLLPNRSHKTLSFVGILACGIISVVLWLLIVFVSITQSIENQWLGKMTSLSAPLRIKPTKYYFNSYYYQIDQYAEASNYKLKSLKDKLSSEVSDPYDPDQDQNIAHLALPDRLPSGALFDPVKRLDATLKTYKDQKTFNYSEFALSAGALHLNFKKDGQNQTLNQILYLTSYAPHILDGGRFLESYDRDDINYLVKYNHPNLPLFSSDNLFHFFDIEHIDIEPFKLKAPQELSKQHRHYEALAEYNAEGNLKKVMLVTQKQAAEDLTLKKGIYDSVEKTFNGQKLEPHQVYLSAPSDIKLEKIKEIRGQRRFLFKAAIQGSHYFFELEPHEFTIKSFKLKLTPSQLVEKIYAGHTAQPSNFVIAPKMFKEQGAKVGDSGSIAYGAKTMSGFQEMKAPVVIIGFYDPGLFSVGAKVLITDRNFIDLVGSSATTYALDPSETNGFLLFPKSFHEAKPLKAQLESDLKSCGLDRYFSVQSFHDYPFVKEVLEQFASDKLIFYLVGFIIFMVALSNVAFLMQILVRDKSKEMAILRSLGASLKSLLKIFTLTGLLLGLFSAAIALFLSVATLSNLGSILKLISLLLNDSVNLSQFYGLSHTVVIPSSLITAIFVITPLLCSLSAFIATRSFKAKSPAQLLKELS